MAFQLYSRSLHPELFVILKSREIQRNGFSARIELTSAGHLVTWNYQGQTLTEVAAASHHPLPQRRRVMSYRLRGSCSDNYQARGGVHYSVQFELEPVSPALFWTFHNEMSQDETRKGLLHHFDSSGRFALGAMSYIHVETRERSLRIQAVHTFPDDCAIVKSESLFQLPATKKKRKA
jgi:hypothetical protein